MTFYWKLTEGISVKSTALVVSVDHIRWLANSFVLVTLRRSAQTGTIAATKERCPDFRQSNPKNPEIQPKTHHFSMLVRVISKESWTCVCIYELLLWSYSTFISITSKMHRLFMKIVLNRTLPWLKLSSPGPSLNSLPRIFQKKLGINSFELACYDFLANATPFGNAYGITWRHSSQSPSPSKVPTSLTHSFYFFLYAQH